MWLYLDFANLGYQELRITAVVALGWQVQVHTVGHMALPELPELPNVSPH